LDEGLHSAFCERTRGRFKRHLGVARVKLTKPEELLERTFNEAFKRGGLEFADFLRTPDSSKAVERPLTEIVAQVVADIGLPTRRAQAVRGALLATVREIIYQGTEEETEFLRRLANTFVLLFLFRCDPKISTYFSKVAGHLRVFVGNSILVPALSEILLEERNRRHWNLLANASRAGVHLYVNCSTIRELAGHFRHVWQVYRSTYEGNENLYSDGTSIKFVGEILIRAYLYNRDRIPDRSFRHFLDRFVTIGGTRMEQDLIEWLRETFAIRFVEDDAFGASVLQQHLNRLSKALAKKKRGGPSQVKADARTILAVMSIRERHNEAGEGGILGLKTWWLSKDTRVWISH